VTQDTAHIIRSEWVLRQDAFGASQLVPANWCQYRFIIRQALELYHLGLRGFRAYIDKVGPIARPFMKYAPKVAGHRQSGQRAVGIDLPPVLDIRVQVVKWPEGTWRFTGFH
jgi:hypothetical protein